MKSKEQIEELVLEKFKHRMFNPFFNVAFVEGYMQCQEDMAQLSEWQLCPKCFGEGQVENVGTSSSVYRICPVCNGNKTLIKPYIK